MRTKLLLTLAASVVLSSVVLAGTSGTDLAARDNSYTTAYKAGNAVLNGGDTIADATPITALPFNDSGSTVGMTDDYDESCPYTGGTAADVVYSYAPAVDEYLRVSTCGTADYDTKLFVYEDAVGTVAGCNDDGPGCSGYTSLIECMEVTTGHTYFIVVDGYGTSEGNFDLLVETMPAGDCYVSPPPANDECANAEFVGGTGNGPVCVDGTTIGATVDCPNVLAWDAVWYEVDLPFGYNDLFVDYCGTEVAFPTVGIVYYDDCNDCSAYNVANAYGWADCDGDTNTTDDRRAQMLFESIVGPTTVMFPVYLGGEQDFNVCFDVTEGVAPPEPCEVYESRIFDVALPFSHEYGNFSEPDVVGGSAGDVGYSFEITEEMVGSCWVFSTCQDGTDYDSDMYLFAGHDGPCEDTPVQLAYNDGDYGCEFHTYASEFEYTFDTAGIYNLVVTGYSNNEGLYNLVVESCGGCQPEGESCENAYVVDSFPYNDAGNTCDYCDDGYANDTKDVVYTFTLDNDAAMLISLCGSGFDTYLSLYDANCEMIDYNDDACGLQSELVYDCLPAGTYFIAIEGYSGCGEYALLMDSAGCPTNVEPVEFALSQNYPNPFNPTTTIDYSIAEPGQVNLNVFNVNGQIVTSLVNEVQAVGSYEITFDASSLPSGVYFYTLQSGNFVDSKKMILVK